MNFASLDLMMFRLFGKSKRRLRDENMLYEREIARLQGVLFKQIRLYEEAESARKHFHDLALEYRQAANVYKRELDRVKP